MRGSGPANAIANIAHRALTEDGLARAKDKLKRKHCDLIVLNNLNEEGAGFGVDTNIVTLIDDQGGEERLPKMSKHQVADQILDWLRQRRLAGR